MAAPPAGYGVALGEAVPINSLQRRRTGIAGSDDIDTAFAQDLCGVRIVSACLTMTQPLLQGSLQLISVREGQAR
jgi:hypothetical protein